MKIKVEFDTDNSAFCEDRDEIHRVLRQAGRKADNMVQFQRETERPLYDSNGNKVGSVEVVAS